jgi:hypothetical protein
MPASQATLDLRVVNAVLCAASGDKALPLVRRSVCIELTENATIYAATDGQILLADMRRREPTDTLLGNYLIAPEHLKDFKITKSGDTSVTLTKRSEFTLRLSRGDQDVDFDLSLADGFPDWRKIIPATTDGVAAQFSGENILRLLKAAKTMGAMRPMAVAYNGDKPALVAWSDLPTFLAIISPVRMNVDQISAPVWTSVF